MYTLDNPKLKKLVSAVQAAHSDDLRKPKYRGNENCLAGGCYVLSEALFHLLGGQKSGWVPQNVKHEGEPHWYLKHKISGAILDPTASQFKTPVPYHEGRGKGFLTKQPSKRAQVVLDRLKNEGLDLPVQKSEPKFSAAFKNKDTGQVFDTGSFHDVDKIPDYQPQEYEEGFVDEGGDFYTREEASLVKNHPTPVFPKLGVPDDRRETMIVTTPQSAAVKIRQLAQATRNAVRATGKEPTRTVQQSNERMAQLYGKAHGASSSHGSTVNSYALGESLRNNPRPKDSISTALHEDVHNVFKRIQIIHGDKARHHLARNLMVHMRALDPQYHAAVHDLVNVRNGSEFLKRTTIPAEEAFAHTIDFLNNPRERERYHNRKKHSPEEARAFDSTMKRGYQKLRYLAEQASPDWLMQKSELEKSHSKSKCMSCSAPPVYECKWAEGMARAWFCAKHWTAWSDEHEGDIDFVRELTNGEVGEKYGEAPGHALKKSDTLPSIPDMPAEHCQAFVIADGIIRQCKKPVKASGLCYLHLAKLGHFLEGDKDKRKSVEVSSIAVFNSEGYLLMGIRNDSGKYTLPGGKADSGESAKDCAHRELWEEAGIKIKTLEYLGSGWGGKNGDVKISVFRGESDDKPTGENDPDEEVEVWEWIDVREGLPEEIKGNLHNGKHDVTLQILGLLEVEKRVGLSKSWKHAFVGAMTAASLSGTPALAQDTVTNDHHQEWKPDGLAEELKPIAHLESSFGKRLKHAPHSKGEYHTAFGAVGLKGVTAHEEYNRTKYLQQVYPDLHDQTKFMEEFKSNPTFYNAVATAHWNRLKKLFGGDVNKTAYAWRWGQGRAAKADKEAIATSPYVQGYNKIYSNIRTDQVALVNPLEKKFEDWLSKSMDRPYTQRLTLYDLIEDPFGHLESTARHTDDGTFYEATEMSDVVDKLKRLGYHGYHDPDGSGPIVFPEFQHLASMSIH